MWKILFRTLRSNLGSLETRHWDRYILSVRTGCRKGWKKGGDRDKTDVPRSMCVYVRPVGCVDSRQVWGCLLVGTGEKSGFPRVRPPTRREPTYLGSFSRNGRHLIGTSMNLFLKIPGHMNPGLDLPLSTPSVWGYLKNREPFLIPTFPVNSREEYFKPVNIYDTFNKVFVKDVVPVNFK